MTWYQLEIDGCPQPQVEALSDTLTELGALSVTLSDKLDEPVLEPMPGTTPLWQHVLLSALFDDNTLMMAAKKQLEQLHPSYLYMTQTLEDKEWERAWMDDFHPMQFGSHLWIVPSWTTPPDPNAINILLDPGLAFGSGTHPTTALCLRWLDGTELSGKTIIDFGCGSGILAIAALKLGADYAYALDIDEQALVSSKANALNNSVDMECLHIDFPNASIPQCDVIVANILINPLLSLKEQFHAMLSANGTLVMSGILSEQVKQLCAHYEPEFEISCTQTLDEWSLVVARKK